MIFQIEFPDYLSGKVIGVQHQYLALDGLLVELAAILLKLVGLDTGEDRLALLDQNLRIRLVARRNRAERCKQQRTAHKRHQQKKKPLPPD